MKSNRLPRRTLLKGVLALPFLEVMSSVSAQNEKTVNPPDRFGIIYLPNGDPVKWAIEKKGGIKKLPNHLEAFNSVKSKINIYSNLYSPKAGSHPFGGATWLIGPAPKGDEMKFSDGLGGVSVDQIAAKQLGLQTKIPSLELITKPEGGFSRDLLRNNISWITPTKPKKRHHSPKTIFSLLNGSASSISDKIHNKSIMDFVLSEIKSLKNKVSIADRHQLDEYFYSVRQIEKRMSSNTTSKQKEIFKKIKEPKNVPENYKENLRIMFDMMLLAFWTDSTRVCSFMMDHEQSNRYFNFIPGVKGMWHAISHWGDISGKTEDDDGKTSWSSKEVKFKQYCSVVKYHHEQVAYFLKRMNEIKENGKTLLDRSMILYGSMMSDGHEHKNEELPIMIAGSANGKYKTGHHISHGKKPVEGLYLGMLEKLGVKENSIGGITDALHL